MKTRALITGLAVVAAIIGGCSKEVSVKIRNHSDISRKIQLTVPSGTRQIGSIAPNSTLTHTIKIKKDLLPASCHYSAGGTARVTFEVSDESAKKVYFHITGNGKMVGPMGKNDVHSEVKKIGESRRVIRKGTVID